METRFRVPVKTQPVIDDGIKKWVAYYRLSKERKGENQYGLLSQRETVEKYIKDNGVIIAEFDEFSTGTNKRKSTSKVYQAIEKCKETGATLIVAKFDRLSRDVAFLQYVLQSKIEFCCCDYPGTNELVLNILCSISQYEGQMIRSRIKAGLAVAKSKGVVLGCPEHLTHADRMKGVKAHHDNARRNPLRKRAVALISSEVSANKDWNAIVSKLNSNGFKTSTGKDFTMMNARMLWLRETRLKQVA